MDGFGGNGRVRQAGSGGHDTYAYGGEQPVSPGLDHMLQSSPTARLFFSRGNVDALQDGIRYKVWLGSERTLVIGRQSDVELGVVMRSMYLQYGNNREGATLAQVRELNALVLDFCVPRVLGEARMYDQYRRDVSTLPTPMEHGEFSSMKGTRVLEQKSFF